MNTANYSQLALVDLGRRNGLDGQGAPRKGVPDAEPQRGSHRLVAGSKK